MMKVWRCKICGDAYLGEEKPSECPFCGADAKYIAPASEYDTPNTVTLSDKSKKNLQNALKLEIGAVQLYECAKKKAEKNEDIEILALFKAIIKVEREHAVRICKFLEIQLPPYDEIKCGNTNMDNLKETQKREDGAVKEYTKAAKEAAEPVIKMFFEAVGEVELKHKLLAEDLMKKQ